jgi:hypothetical protein
MLDNGWRFLALSAPTAKTPLAHPHRGMTQKRQPGWLLLASEYPEETLEKFPVHAQIGRAFVVRIF